MNEDKNWYTFSETDQLDSPALLFYPERIKKNISILKGMLDDPDKLRPHIKTSKTKEVVLLMLEAGINKFKCATIAEAELLAACNAPDVLLAYQPTYPKLLRFINLYNHYPGTRFSCLIDNIESVQLFSKTAIEKALTIEVYIDLNVGMNRTGIRPGKDAISLYEHIVKTTGLKISGFHAYDGHIRDIDFVERKNHCNKLFVDVEKMRLTLNKKGYSFPLLIAGGSPTFQIHSKRENVECSPGTFVFWDKGYHDNLPEQKFHYAALVLTRVISLPAKNKICIDLGYKSIAAENKLNKRVYFINEPALEPISQSEEHMVLKVEKNHQYKVGDELFALPYHICPTVALYENGVSIESGHISKSWKIIARNRIITY